MRNLFIILLLLLTSCTGFRTGLEAAYRWKDSHGLWHEVRGKIIIDRIKAREKEHGNGGVDVDRVMRDLVELSEKKGVKLDLVKCKEKGCLLVNGKRYDLKSKDDLRHLYTNISKLVKKEQ